MLEGSKESFLRKERVIMRSLAILTLTFILVLGGGLVSRALPATAQPATPAIGSVGVSAGALVIYVESGELTYTVSEGEAIVTHAAEAGTPAPSERIGPGDAALLRPGDAVYEEGVV